MSQTAQQIVSLACSIARVPGYLSQGGQFLNMVLDELCQTYDLEQALTTTTIALTTSVGAGPYTMPTDYLRARRDGVTYYINGTAYGPVSISIEEYNRLPQQSGLQNYPELFAVDLSPVANQLPPIMYVWPPAGGAYTLFVRYYRQMPQITAPETSTAIPWFSNQNYLVTRLAGELMKLADDDRSSKFLGEGPEGAQGILNRFLKLQSDDEGRAKQVTLDERFFRRGNYHAKNTKLIGW